MRVIAKNRISDLIVMRNLHIVEKNAIFQLGGVSDYAPASYYHVSSQICAGTYLGTVTDDCRTVDLRSRMDGYVLSDQDVVGVEGETVDTVVNKLGYMSLYQGQKLPRIFA